MTASFARRTAALFMTLLMALSALPAFALKGDGAPTDEAAGDALGSGESVIVSEIDPCFESAEAEDGDRTVIRAKVPEGDDGSAARKEFEERMLSTHDSEALWDTPDANGAYYGDYVLIYNPQYNAAAKSTGTLTGLIDTTILDHIASVESDTAELGHDDDMPCAVCGTPDITEEDMAVEPPRDTEAKEILTFNVGDTHDFTLLAKYCVVSNNTVNFTCYAKGEHCYVWSPTDKTAGRFYPLDQIDSTYPQLIADEFDAKYSTMRSAFGDHWNGSQGDGRVNLMFYNLKDNDPGVTIAGFFAPTDYTNNNMPMINIDTMPCLCYVSGSQVVPFPVSSQYNTMVHEYQHQIHYSVCHTYSKDTESWLTEMMSAAAEEICYPGSSLSERICTWIGKSELESMATNPYYEVKSKNYAPQTGQALYTWNRDATGQTSLSQYAKVSLYAQYLYAHNNQGNNVFKTILWEFASHASYTSGDAMAAVMNDIIFANNDLSYLNRYFWIALVMNPISSSSYFTNYGFKMQDGYDPSEYYDIQNLYSVLCPVVYTGAGVSLGGGSAIVVKPAGGRFVPPADADPSLEYYGIFTNERLIAESTSGYEYTRIFTATSDHPWVYSDGAAMSANSGVHGSTAACAYYAYPNSGVGSIRFSFKVEGEGSGTNFYDGLRVYLDYRDEDHKQLEIWSTNGQWMNYELVIPENYYGTVIWFEYVKDGSVSNGTDCAYIDNVEFINKIDHRLKSSSSSDYLHFTTGGAYPWEYSPIGVISTNSGEPNTVSTIQCTVDAEAGDVLYIAFVSNGEESSTYGTIYDGLDFYFNGYKTNTWGIADGTRYAYIYESGTYSFRWTYFKDESVDSDLDYAVLQKVYIIKSPTSDVISSVNVSGYHIPKAGEHASDIINQLYVPSSANYKISWAHFYCDTDGTTISNGAVFEEGKEYSLQIRLEPRYTQHFTNDTYYYINNDISEVDQGITGLIPSRSYFVIWTVPREAESPYIMGDVNNDSFVNANDALMVLRYSLHIITTMPNMAAADIDGNGTINANDALAILRAALGIITL